jgi:prepilin signal peptidase PulO-like enzyme (type II secretory pathway)
LSLFPLFALKKVLSLYLYPPTMSDPTTTVENLPNFPRQEEASKTKLIWILFLVVVLVSLLLVILVWTLPGMTISNSGVLMIFAVILLLLGVSGIYTINTRFVPAPA